MHTEVHRMITMHDRPRQGDQKTDGRTDGQVDGRSSRQ